MKGTKELEKEAPKKEGIKTTKEKVSYCLGLESGRSLRQQFDDMDLRLVAEGFHDALSSSDPKLPAPEVQNILNSLRQQIEMQRRQYVAQVSEQNKKDGEEFLAENRSKSGVVTIASGLQYKVLSTGNGPSPTVLDTVTIHYRGSFLDGNIFDDSYRRNQPVALPLNRMIPGWVEALKMMKVGDKWQVFVPSYLAYGENGFPPHIAPNTTLIFEIELLSINA